MIALFGIRREPVPFCVVYINEYQKHNAGFDGTGFDAPMGPQMAEVKLNTTCLWT